VQAHHRGSGGVGKGGRFLEQDDQLGALAMTVLSAPLAEQVPAMLYERWGEVGLVRWRGA
jgi:hypothetical protein